MDAATGLDYWHDTSGVIRHKVIGFVDAATKYAAPEKPAIIPRHKVIGFVDAATVLMASIRSKVSPPQGHWLRGCRD